MEKSVKKSLIISSLIMILLVGGYCTAVFSHIPFIEYWRTVYIETAMSTMTHQWLATWFIPQSVIDEVLAEKEANMDAQKGLDSSDEEMSFRNEEEDFYSTYWELNTESFKNYVDTHSVTFAKGFENVVIEDFDQELGITTTNGDPLLVLDVPNNLMIVGITGKDYVGKLAIIKDSSQVNLEKSKSFGSFGEEIESYGERTGAILAINASSFKDSGGHGKGDYVKGVHVEDGVDYGHARGGFWRMFGIRKSGMFHIEDYSKEAVKDYRWAVEFYPALIVDGEKIVQDTYGLGIQPRSTIGQTKDGDFLMLIVDGRQVGYSLGCSVEECANVLIRYKAYQAMNLDGGSSSVMWYKGQLITKSSSASGRGRYTPNALVVMPAAK